MFGLFYWIVIIFIERKYRIKKVNERKISKKVLQCIVMLAMVVISFWIYVSVLSGRFNQYMALVFFGGNYRCLYGNIGD